MLEGRGLCNGPIPDPEESYRSVSVCNLDTLLMRRPTPEYGSYATGKKNE
jgi:hypothetical protein